MKDKKLLFSITAKDFEIQTFTAGGKGGQRQNRKETGVRLIHKASGARGEARDSRNQIQNRQAAFQRLLETPAWRTWHKLEVFKRLGLEKVVEEEVEKLMEEKNLLVEIQTKDGWSKQNP